MHLHWWLPQSHSLRTMKNTRKKILHLMTSMSEIFLRYNTVQILLRLKHWDDSKYHENILKIGHKVKTVMSKRNNLLLIENILHENRRIPDASSIRSCIRNETCGKQLNVEYHLETFKCCLTMLAIYKVWTNAQLIYPFLFG